MNKNQKSRRSHGFVWMLGSGLLLSAAALLTTSCAQDGYDDDERFDNGVNGQTLTSPSAESITITPSADGKTQTISWPVVMGAGGYKVNLADIGNSKTIINDSIVDGCSVTTSREEDTNYKLTILAMGNTKSGNRDASSASEYSFSTFTPTYMAIPAGANLNEWFAANPIPADAEGNLNYDLEAGAQYTLSGTLDFNINAVTLRSTSKSNHATINMTGEAMITFAAPFNLKYVDVDCTAQEIGSTNHGIFAFSKDPSAAPKGTDIDAVKYKWANPLIEDPVTFVSCNFKNVRSYFFWDNQQAVCAMTLLVDNCLVQLSPQKAFSGGVFWTNKGGHINDLLVTNSTFYELPDNPGDYKYFYQAGMVSGEEIYAVKETASNSTSYQNSTFYHVTWDNGQWGNYNRMGGRACSHWVMTNCIFYDCSPSGVPRRFLHGKKGQDVTFLNNTYMKNDGTFQDITSDGSHDYDLSGTTIDEDPQFANPSAGDFTISGATQIARRTGDPRWLP